MAYLTLKELDYPWQNPLNEPARIPKGAIQTDVKRIQGTSKQVSSPRKRGIIFLLAENGFPLSRE